MLVELFHLTDLVVNKGIPFTGIALMMATKIPETFTITIPMSLIMSVIMTFGRMANQNELTALRMAGYPLHSMLVPPLLVGLVLAVGLVSIQEYGLPQLSSYKTKVLEEMELVNPVGLLKPRTFLELPPYTIYAKTIDGRVMTNVWIEDRSHDNPQIILSQRGKWIRKNKSEFLLTLEDGTLHQEGKNNRYRVLEFDQQTLSFNPETSGGSIGTGEVIIPLTERYQKYRQLDSKLRKKNQKNKKRLEKKIRKMGTEFHRTLALPFASFFLVLATAPTGLLVKHFGAAADFFFCLGIFFVYYLMLTLLETFAKTGSLSPLLSMWMPNLTFGVIGLGMFWYLKKYGI